jgi:hypothetical protein
MVHPYDISNKSVSTLNNIQCTCYVCMCVDERILRIHMHDKCRSSDERAYMYTQYTRIHKSSKNH